MLAAEDTILVIIDIQEKLTAAMHEKEALVENAVKMVKGAQILGLPILHTEQNPNGLGRTVPQLGELLKEAQPFSKLTFSCCGERPFVGELEKLGRHQILIGGIESHVCVYQSVVDLMDLGYEVEVITDMVSSRTRENKQIGLAKCEAYGAYLTSVETALFELLQVAEGDKFKQMLKVVK
ncbi:MAG: hydrolase [Deltaproteobacteria bacterium]